MLVKTPQIVLERYSKLAIKNGSKKVKVLANLPKRTEEERKVIRRVLSNAHCRACGSCCNQRIHIGRRDPNFKAFMREVSKREKEFRLTSEGKNGKKYLLCLGKDESQARTVKPFWETDKSKHLAGWVVDRMGELVSGDLRGPKAA